MTDNRIWKIPAGSTSPIVFAGKATVDSVDGQGAAAGFYNPGQLAIDVFGNIFVADHHRVRKVTPQGMVSTVSTAFPSLILGIAVDTFSNVYASIYPDNRIWKVPAGSTTPVVFAGSASGGLIDGTGPEARFNYPFFLTSDRFNNIYVADRNNKAVRKITPEGVVSTVASASNLDLRGVAADAIGNIYASSMSNNQILKIALE